MWKAGLILLLVTGGASDMSISTFGSGAGVGKYTADPCGGLDEGSVFYNDTNDYLCFCNGSGDDMQVHAPATPCAW